MKTRDTELHPYQLPLDKITSYVLLYTILHYLMLLMCIIILDVLSFDLISLCYQGRPSTSCGQQALDYLRRPR